MIFPDPGKLRGMNTGTQFLRVAQLVVANTNLGTGRDLSQMNFLFSVRQADNETPNTMVVRIFNLSLATENEILSQYTSVALQVGYEGTGLTVAFTGTIKMFRKGKESSTEKFLEISAADGDLGYNFGLVNTTLGAGSTYADVLRHSAAAMSTGYSPTAAAIASSGGVIFPRGKVMFGLARLQLANMANTLVSRWSIQDGIITFVQDSGYLEGEVIVMNETTGMVGTPESTPDGVEVRCLMNAKIKTGSRIQIDSSQIVTNSTTQAEIQAANGDPGINFPTYTSRIYPATVLVGKGIYRVIVVEHTGDNREGTWLSSLTCLAVDPSSPADASVKLGG